jgi:hypothetical protein
MRQGDSPANRSVDGTIEVVICMQVRVSIKSNDPFQKQTRLTRGMCALRLKLRSISSLSNRFVFLSFSFPKRILGCSEPMRDRECVTDLDFRARCPWLGRANTGSKKWRRRKKIDRWPFLALLFDVSLSAPFCPTMRKRPPVSRAARFPMHAFR